MTHKNIEEQIDRLLKLGPTPSFAAALKIIEKAMCELENKNDIHLFDTLKFLEIFIEKSYEKIFRRGLREQILWEDDGSSPYSSHE